MSWMFSVCKAKFVVEFFFAYIMRFQALTLVVEFYLKKLYSTQDLVWAQVHFMVKYR